MVFASIVSLMVFNYVRKQKRKLSRERKNKKIFLLSNNIAREKVLKT